MSAFRFKRGIGYFFSSWNPVGAGPSFSGKLPYSLSDPLSVFCRTKCCVFSKLRYSPLSDPFFSCVAASDSANCLPKSSFFLPADFQPISPSSDFHLVFASRKGFLSLPHNLSRGATVKAVLPSPTRPILLNSSRPFFPNIRADPNRFLLPPKESAVPSLMLLFLLSTGTVPAFLKAGAAFTLKSLACAVIDSPPTCPSFSQISNCCRRDTSPDPMQIAFPCALGRFSVPF